MQDRVPTYPGRVRLTPVPGQDGLYDLERADEPTVVGTPINKATLLTDATAELIWQIASERPSNPTVNDALSALSARAKIATGFYYGTGVIHRQSNPKTIDISFLPFLFILSNENISIFADADLGDGNVYVGHDTITLLGQSGTVTNRYLQYVEGTTFHRDGKIIYEAGNSGLSFYLKEQSGFPATSAKDVYNGSAELYRWIAIGVGSE